MGIGVSIFLIAVGAILAFAVEITTEGIDLNAVGVILMVVGVLGLVLSFVFWDRLGFGPRRQTYVRDSYVDDTTRRPGTVREERRIVEDL